MSDTAAAAAAPAPTPTPAPAPAVAPAPTPSDWTTGMNDDLKGYAQNKGFKTPGEVLESYRNYEKLQGVPQDRLLRLPENMDTPEGRAFWEKLGAPKEAKDYALKVPETNGDPKLAEWAQGVFQEVGLPRGMAEKLYAKWNERSQAGHAQNQENERVSLQTAQQNLERTWGAAFEQNKNIADAAALRMGMGEKEVNALGKALGPDKAMQLLHKLGAATGEAPFIDGKSVSSGMMAPDQAKSRINEMIGDAGFRKRLEDGDRDAKQQWDNAHKMAFPGMHSL